MDVQNKKQESPVEVGRTVCSGFKKFAESHKNILLMLQKVIAVAHICQCARLQTPFVENLGLAAGTQT